MTGYPFAAWIGLVSLAAAILTAAAILRFRPPLPAPSRGRLGYVDGLRGLLALGVFLHHFVIVYHFRLAGSWTSPPVRFYRLTGHAGVAVFFMITGFLFWHRVLAADGRLAWGRFFVKRFFRLAPLYWAALGFILIVVFARGGLALKEPLWTLAEHIGDWLIFRGKPDINGYERTALIIAGVTWSLTYEWAFYLSLPILALTARSRAAAPLLGFLLIIGIAVLADRNYRVPYLRLSSKWFALFLAGGICAALRQRPSLREAMRGKAGGVLSLGALLALFAFMDEGPGMGQSFLLSLFFLPIALGNSLFGFLNRPALLLLGETSYSIYLLHGIVLYILYQILFPGFFVPGRATGALLLSMPLTACGVVLSAWISYSLIERPGIAWGERILASRRMASAPAPGALPFPTETRLSPQECFVPPLPETDIRHER